MKTRLSIESSGDNYEDRKAFLLVLKAEDLAIAISHIGEKLRQETKYSDSPMSLEEFKEFFWDTINEYEISELLE